MHNSQIIADRIKVTCKSNGYSVNAMLASCGLGKNTIGKINGGADVYASNLAKIADYLDCSVDYLLGRTDNPAVNR